MNQKISPQGKLAKPLTSEEKAALIDQTEKNIKGYKIGFVFACLSIVIIVGIIVAPSMYIALRKQQKKLKQIQNEDLKVYEVNAILRRKTLGSRTPLVYAYDEEGSLIPGEILSENDTKSGIKKHIDQTITLQYIPDISTNRLYIDSQGKGYNFITKTALD